LDIQIRILLIILVNLFFYYKTIYFGGVCDDIPVFNQDVKIPNGWWMYFWYHLFGRKYKDFKLAHCLTLAVHIVTCVLIYIAFGCNKISLVTALLFSVNPVNNQCSIWISGRQYGINTICALLMWIFPYWSIAPYLFGTYFSGASLIFFPLMFLFTKYWYLAFLVVIGLLREHIRIFNKTDPHSKFNTESNKELLTVRPNKLILALKTYGYHFINCLTVFRLGFYHKYMFLHGVNKDTNKESYKIDKFFFTGVVLALTTLLTKDIGLIWFTINIAMWCNFVTFNQTIGNRYIYLGNVGLMFTLTKLLMFYPPLALAVWVYYATLLSKFVIFYKSEYWSIEWAYLEQPDFFYLWQNRAVYCFINQNYHGAIGNLNKANELKPNDWKVLYNMAQVYLMLGNMNASKKFYEEASKCNIDGREVVIGNLMKRLGAWIEEIEKQAKENKNQVQLDLGKFDMQR